MITTKPLKIYMFHGFTDNMAEVHVEYMFINTQRWNKMIVVQLRKQP